MKIAIFHELPFGGARDVVYYFGEGFTQNKIIVDLYYVSSKKDEREASFFRKIYFFKFVPQKWSGNNWKTRLYKDSIELYNLKNLHKKIAKKINANNYDFVLVNGSQYVEAPFILKHLSTFKIFYCHDPNYRIIYEKVLQLENINLNSIKKTYEKINRNFRKFLDKTNFKRADLIIANSFFAKKIIKKTYAKDSTVLYPGVDINFFSPKNVNKDIDIFYIGSHQRIDDFELLKRTLSTLPKNIVTKKIMYEDGWIADKKVILDYYRRSKLVVCLAFNEPFGLVAIEAMACGVPVIAVNEGGYKETVINDKTGYLVNRNPKELAHKINELLNDFNKLNKLSRNARKHTVKNWNWSLKSRLLSEFLKKIKK
ncbi:MAG: hypothetical protein COU25_00420 [Candidatus Levybacteria bacterium CG10_big_fil_rev_8_21_14_0_10_35_13]|nr:MAG: hypothetical protein COU25_00420 [Candidatus Levybacteria bacterium CG10_big_fil_rev_8_21_14_0_10_35_13]